MSSSERDVTKRTYTRSSFSRSPHPYHRRRFKAKDDSASSTEGFAGATKHGSSDSSDHALEADDEKGPLLRLPAPPIRASKGLKGVRDRSIEWTPAISPVPTPPNEKQAYFPATKGPKVEASQHEQNERYLKYTKRRRTELARRLSETLLLVVIGVMSSSGLASASGFAGKAPVVNPELWKWRAELALFFSMVFSCYLLYPFRRAFVWLSRGLDCSTALRRGFHVPSRFDPGTLLYPVLLPLFIAMSVRENNATILVNIILGLSSMPQQVIPLPDHGSFCLHWILTLVPVSYLPPFRRLPSILKLSPNAAFVNLQELSLIFPLHHSLVMIISNLVTMSLDPSEIQLMSTGLVNLLVFASTPQTQLLKGLLWVGGFCLFVFCERALKWEVALARIPAWRFARNRPSSKGVSGRLNRLLKALLPEYRTRFASIATLSDSEDDNPPMFALSQPKENANDSLMLDGSFHNVLQKRVSVDSSNTNGYIKPPNNFPQLARAATFSTFGRAATIAVKWRKAAMSSNPFLRLTFLQAQALKLLLALYAYSAVAFTILVPVRYFISTRALADSEPVGWAIGYFLGDIPNVRMFVVANNLDWWIKLPVHKSHAQLPKATGVIETYRQSILGPANTRLLLAGYCVLVVSCGIAAVLQLQRVVEVDTRRKVFHGVMVAMLLPTIPVDPCFFALALMIVLAVFLMLDLFRASQLPPVSRPLTNFLAPYVDGRDHRGPVIVSHIFLLIGCAIPLWLSLSAMERSGSGPLKGWDVSSRDLSMVSGVICVGMGDAAASLIGRRYGRTKWYWAGGKSIEGSAAFTIAVMAGLTASWFWLRIGGWVEFHVSQLPLAMLKSLVAGAGASLMESTLTAANDNVVVPIGLWLLVRCLGI